MHIPNIGWSYTLYIDCSEHTISYVVDSTLEEVNQIIVCIRSIANLATQGAHLASLPASTRSHAMGYMVL